MRGGCVASWLLFDRLESMRRQKAEASKREQEWRKLEEEQAQSVTEVKRVNKDQCDTGHFLLLLIFCSFAIISKKN